MEKAEFIFTLAAGFFSVFLLGWHGYNGYTTDWIYGFLAVFWSLIMMLRLMTLTAPYEPVSAQSNLAQKLIRSFREKQEQNRQQILENSFGGSFALFLGATFVFAAWQIFCAAFPANAPTLQSLQSLLQNFNSDVSWTQARIFDWGQVFLLLLSLSMMGFVLRSHAGNRSITRAILIVLCGYAVTGLIVFSGLEAGKGFAVAQADVMGNGSGAVSYLLGTIEAGKTLSLFDILLLDSGLGGLAILTFALFVPLAYISLSAQKRSADWMVIGCGMIIGIVMILSVFLSFTPALGAFQALCWMGLFLGWGASENTLRALPLTKLPT